LPVGALVDRTKRVPPLAISVVLWSLASLLSAFAGSYSFLLLTRLALGAVNATAGPAIASLTGDYFQAAERGRVYAYILGGEVVGTAASFIVSGSVAGVISWRAPFALLALPGLWLARTLWRTVPEPVRGGQSWLRIGAADLDEAVQTCERDGERERVPGQHEQEVAYELISERGVRPDPRLVLADDPREMTLIAAVRYVLRIPTNVRLIVGSSLGYFFFAGLQTFVMLFIRGQYGVGPLTAELVLALLVGGALAGTLLSGRVTDLLLRRGMLAARVWVPGICYLGAAGLLLPGFVIHTLTPALWFDIGGAALLAAANPPLDAARLDIVPSGLWGRAEGTRSFLRSLAQALAPLLFGGLASLIAGIAPGQAPVGTHPGAISAAEAKSLGLTFLVMLTSLAAAGVLLVRGRWSYARDVATAAAAGADTERAGRSDASESRPVRSPAIRKDRRASSGVAERAKVRRAPRSRAGTETSRRSAHRVDARRRGGPRAGRGSRPTGAGRFRRRR
jgi:MFS family permease